MIEVSTCCIPITIDINVDMVAANSDEVLSIITDIIQGDSLVDELLWLVGWEWLNDQLIIVVEDQIFLIIGDGTLEISSLKDEWSDIGIIGWYFFVYF